jgi:SSS family solute:Na+ symporter
VFFFAAGHHHDAGLHPAAGRVPARDVGQQTCKTAQRGPVIGGCAYILFAFVPMFIVVAAAAGDARARPKLLADDPQKVLPTLVMGHMPFVLQVAVLRRAAVGHQVDRVGHAAGAVHHLRREHPAQPATPA